MDIPQHQGISTLQAKAYRIIRAHIQEHLSSHQLNPTNWAFLNAIAAAQNGIRLTEAAQSLGVKAPLVTMMADRLIKRELVTRVPHHIDKRAKLLLATPAGKKLVQTVEAELEHEVAHLFRGTTKRELQTYRKVTEAIIANEALPRQTANPRH